MRRVAGIDVGGTFTDLLLYEAGPGGSRVRLAKIPTTAANQADGVLAAVGEAGAVPSDLDLVIHGTTTTTNAVLERKVAKVGLVTTRGFRDTLELGRRTRPKPYGMTGSFEPLIPRQQRLEIDERMDAAGKVVTPLDEGQLEAAVAALVAMGCEKFSSSTFFMPMPIRRTSCGPVRSRAGYGPTSTSRSATRCSPSSASTSAGRRHQ